MNRRTLAICDPEQAYACRLMDALSRREDFPFEVLAFTGAERLQDSLARKPVQILLIAQGLFREEMKDWYGMSFCCRRKKTARYRSFRA